MVSRSGLLSSHLGVGRLLRRDKSADRARDIAGLLGEWNRFGLVADVDLEAGRAGRDRQPLISQLPDDVERLSWRLLEGQAQLVRCNGALDFGADMRGGLEEAICGHESVERLVRTLEVVVAQVVLEPPLRIDHVREHGASQELVPERLPESLDLSERLRMLRPAPNVLDSHPRE